MLYFGFASLLRPTWAPEIQGEHTQLTPQSDSIEHCWPKGPPAFGLPRHTSLLQKSWKALGWGRIGLFTSAPALSKTSWTWNFWAHPRSKSGPSEAQHGQLSLGHSLVPTAGSHTSLRNLTRPSHVKRQTSLFTTILLIRAAWKEVLWKK